MNTQQNNYPNIMEELYYECKEVITELLEIFEKLENMKFNMDEIEKIRIIYVALPNSIQNIVCPTEEIRLEKFLEKTQYVCNES